MNKVSLCTLLCALACSGAAHGASVQLSPVADASIFNGTLGADTLADGAGPHLWLAVTAEGLNRRALLRFDVSALPPGSVVRSARLVLYESRSRTDQVVRVHRVLAPWTEGPADGGGSGTGVAAQPGDVTWQRRSHPAQAWQAPGGDWAAQASAQALVGPPNQTYAFGSSAGLVADVQAWVDLPAANHGWVLIGDEITQQSAKRFESRENTAAANRPRLEVDYDPPAPAGASDGDVPLPAWALGLLALGLALRLRPRA